MFDKFSEYYSLSQEQLKNLWNDCFFVFDTNVLFNLYRYSKDTTSQFLNELSKLKPRLWLPYHIGLEFHRNRRNILSDEIAVYREFQIKFAGLCDEVENKNRNPFLSVATSAALAGLKDKIKTELQVKISEYEEQLATDNILQSLVEIFGANIGSEFSSDELIAIYKSGEIRYKEDIPPGYQDKKKPHPDKFGDLIIWHELMKKSKTEKKPLIFVTDDSKEDWWLVHSGKTISPRPELLKEFQRETSQLCHFYKPFQFLKYANQYLGGVIKNETIDEVKELPIKSFAARNLLVNIKVRSLGTAQGLAKFSTLLETDGYKISLEAVPPLSDNLFVLSVLLPNISDLERRFNNKYLSTLGLYDIELVGYNSRPFNE